MNSGFLNIIKPPGMTSHDVVDVVRKRLPRKTKVGHLGTLDPAAAGVLPLAVGAATKLIPLIPDLGSSMKAYLGNLQFGVTTTTDDLEGEVLTRADSADLHAVTEAQVESVLKEFEGDIAQIPPQVSAIRKDGVRAYKRVRDGETVELEARQVKVAKLALLEYRQETGMAKVFMVCGSGTYVRSVARDVGEKLGVGGALAFLLRTHSGTFQLNSGISLEELLFSKPEDHLLAMDQPFHSLPATDFKDFSQRGQRVEGNFSTQGLLLSPKGLLRTDVSQPGTAVVEAVFEEAFG